MSKSFTVHIFISHDPFIASMLLPELFADFPDSKWILPPTREVPVRVKDEQPTKEISDKLPFRDTLGRYILSAPIPVDTSLQSLRTKFATDFEISENKLAQFTVFPQSNTASVWHDELLPLDLAISKVLDYDKDAAIEDSQQPRILHLVLETKAAALARPVGDGFDYSKASVFQIRDSWSVYKSFWHMNQKPRPCGFVSSLIAYRNNKEPSTSLIDAIPDISALPQLKSQLEQSKAFLASGQAGSNHVEYHVEMDILQYTYKIEYLEALMKKNKKIALLVRYAQEWEEWVVKKNYATLNPAEFRNRNIEETVTVILQQILDMSAAWNESPRHKLLQEEVEEEYYASRPWMTVEERAKDRERLLNPVKTAT